MAESTSPVFLITGCSTRRGREMVGLPRHSDCPPCCPPRVCNQSHFNLWPGGLLRQHAGFVQAGAVEEVSPHEVLALLNTNFFGLVNTTKAFLLHFRGRCTGTPMNISSLGSCQKIPGSEIYRALKAAVDAISDTWAEFAEYGVRSISPPVNFLASSRLCPD
ncbi:hypothetical protein DFH09DRAFT_1083878 [Mycena vulgaris]|nr:hypothetical protein DFH09DRAFT_1083878 [Mycena vulgaris]